MRIALKTIKINKRRDNISHCWTHISLFGILGMKKSRSWKNMLTGSSAFYLFYSDCWGFKKRK